MKTSLAITLLLAAVVYAAPQAQSRKALIEASSSGSYTVRVKEAAERNSRPDDRSSNCYGQCTVDINTSTTYTYLEGELHYTCDVSEIPYYDPFTDCFCCVIL
ncbi:hypothetical protein FHG87_009206 [Trinorchestia longiramus]|nr:hypothetical protein FHG87_009206 [Trinorchestia longiramus]